MDRVAIVTDTSADLLPEQAREAGIRLVPLSVSFGEQTFQAVTELSNEAFYERLTAPGAPLPRTAAPNPQQFEAAYREALAAGASSVACVTLSGAMSATYASAAQAAAKLEPGQVQVLDSRSVTHGLGIIALAAAELARDGASQAEIAAHVRDLSSRSRMVFTVDTLEYLQKGGRIGRASALLGTVLSIKPILGLEDGEVSAFDRRRTAAKARARLLELVAAEPVERATVLHTVTPGIEGFRDQVAEAVGLPAGDLGIGLAGPVAGTHVGPGIYGVAWIVRG